MTGWQVLGPDETPGPDAEYVVAVFGRRGSTRRMAELTGCDPAEIEWLRAQVRERVRRLRDPTA